MNKVTLSLKASYISTTPLPFETADLISMEFNNGNLSQLVVKTADNKVITVDNHALGILKVRITFDS